MAGAKLDKDKADHTGSWLSVKCLWIIFTVSMLVNVALNVWCCYDAASEQRVKSVVTWPKYMQENLLVEEFSDPHSLNVNGWWGTRTEWTAEVRCYNQDWSLCPLVYSAQCSPTSIPELLQYLVFTSDQRVNQLSLRAHMLSDYLVRRPAPSALNDAESSETEEADDKESLNRSGTREDGDDSCFHGVKALVTLSDGSTKVLTLRYPSVPFGFLERRADFEVRQADQFVISVLVMLTCFGYEGTVQFANIVLTSSLRVDLSAADAVRTEPGPSSDALDDLSKELPRENHAAEGLDCASAHSVTKALPQSLYEVVEIHGPTADESTGERPDGVTWFTQLSLDRLDMLRGNTVGWDGPVSAAVFVDGSDVQWAVRYVEKKVPASLRCPLCSLVVVRCRDPCPPPGYPINRLRNEAMSRVRTRWMLSLDVDFRPSIGLQAAVLRAVRFVTSRVEDGKVALVVPVFEMLDDVDAEVLDDRLLDEFDFLVAEANKETPNVIPFRAIESPSAHQATEYGRWYVTQWEQESDFDSCNNITDMDPPCSGHHTLDSESEVPSESSAPPYPTPRGPYPVAYYHDRYEPYLVLPNYGATPPTYDERFTGYGMNKVTHLARLYGAGYGLWVVPRGWALHQPHPESVHMLAWKANLTTRLWNRLARFECLRDILCA